MISPHERTRLSFDVPPGRHALIIEDEELIAASIEDELRSRGYTTVDVARSEDQAIALAERQEPHLITVDAKLEQGSGVDAVLRICATRAIPVIVVTGYPFDVTLSGVVTLGKPFNAATFAAAYEQATARPFSAAAPTSQPQ